MASTDVVQATCEKANSEGRVEQDRDERINPEKPKDQKVNIKDSSEEAISGTREEEASLGRNEGIVGPSVAIVFNNFTVCDVVGAVKKLKEKLRIVITLTSLNGLTEEEERILKSVDILLVQPRAVSDSSKLCHLPNIKWMHTQSAGVDEIIKSKVLQKLSPTCILTRNVGCFDSQMAEYVVTMIVARERNYREFWENQPKKLWAHKPNKSLSDQSLGIVGLGSIGKEVARLAKLFGLRVWALVRSLPTESTKCKDVDEYRLVADIGDLLSSCDYVVSVLPSTPSTDGFFDGDTLSKGKTKKPVFMNIGRGNVVKNSTIIHALKEEWISHAILDVFEKEPLPQDSPLWTHPHVTVTPHTSALGLTNEKFLRSFLENYDRYMAGRPLLYMVDWEKGY